MVISSNSNTRVKVQQGIAASGFCLDSAARQDSWSVRVIAVYFVFLAVVSYKLSLWRITSLPAANQDHTHAAGTCCLLRRSALIVRLTACRQLVNCYNYIQSNCSVDFETRSDTIGRLALVRVDCLCSGIRTACRPIMMRDVATGSETNILDILYIDFTRLKKPAEHHLNQ